MSDPDVLDRRAFGSILALRSESDGALDDLLDAYLTDGTERLQRLSAAAANSDATVIAEEAHALRGASNTFGAVRVGVLSRELERRARAGRLEDVGCVVEELRCEFTRASAVLRRAWSP